MAAGPRKKGPKCISDINLRQTERSLNIGFCGLEPDIPQLEMNGKTENERRQSKIRQQKPRGRVAQLGPSGPGGEFVRAELAAL